MKRLTRGIATSLMIALAIGGAHFATSTSTAAGKSTAASVLSDDGFVWD